MWLSSWQFLPLPLGLQIRTTTLVAAAFVLGVVWWRTQRLGLAYVVMSAWVSLYELAYVATAAAFGRFTVLDVIATSGLLGWCVAAWVMGHRPRLSLLPGFLILWGFWMSIGFPVNAHGVIADPTAEYFNVVTKTWLALAYALGHASRADRRWSVTWARVPHDSAGSGFRLELERIERNGHSPAAVVVGRPKTDA